MITNKIFTMAPAQIYKILVHETRKIQYMEIPNLRFSTQNTPLILRVRLIKFTSHDDVYNCNFELLGVNFCPAHPSVYSIIRDICENLTVRKTNYQTFRFIEKPKCYFFTTREMNNLTNTLVKTERRKENIKIYKTQKALTEKIEKIQLNRIIYGTIAPTFSIDPEYHIKSYYIINKIIMPKLVDLKYPHIIIQGFCMNNTDAYWFPIEWEIDYIKINSYISVEQIVQKYEAQLNKLLKSN